MSVSSTLAITSLNLARLSVVPKPAARSTQSLRVLIADGDASARRAMSEVVRAQGHEVRSVADGLSALELYDRWPADLVLAEWFLVGLDGLGLCAQIRSRSTDGRHVHFVLVSSVVDAQTQSAAMIAGADDALQKPFAPEALAARLVVAQRLAAAHRRVMAANLVLRADSERATADAATDPLTGAMNRRQFDVDLQAMCDDRRCPQPSALAMIDVDHFKTHNDALGHLAGDHVLREIVRTARNTLRREDEIYRYGGDEFAVILRGVDPSAALAAMERFVMAIQSLSSAQPRITPGMVTVSIGIAPGLGVSPEAWIANADSALYRAKRAGRNRVESTEGMATARSAPGLDRLHGRDVPPFVPRARSPRLPRLTALDLRRRPCG